LEAAARILLVLRRARGRHLSAEEVQARVNRSGPPVHLATVYRALQSLTATGRIKRSSLSENHAHYELADNYGVHLLCESCGRLREERLEPAERLLSSLKRRLDGKFTIKSWQMQVVGRCSECRR
jgi:Fe2+ or Zn2+ uptake regulation protein